MHPTPNEVVADRYLVGYAEGFKEEGLNIETQRLHVYGFAVSDVGQTPLDHSRRSCEFQLRVPAGIRPQRDRHQSRTEKNSDQRIVSLENVTEFLESNFQNTH